MTRRPIHRGSVLVCALLALWTAGCVRGCTSSRPPIHLNPNMDYQPKAQAQESSDFFYDGAAMRPEIPGTVPRGGLRDNAELLTGKNTAGEFLTAPPLPLDDALAARGAQRYAIYCAPCHDERGGGKGILYERAGVPTASFHDETKFANYPDGQIYDVITNGLGLMPGYRYPIPPRDRWAIVAHVRRLQQEKKARDAALAE